MREKRNPSSLLGFFKSELLLMDIINERKNSKDSIILKRKVIKLLQMET